MIDTCPKCRDLYDDRAGTGFCGRCSTIAELLSAADALNAQVKSELARAGVHGRLALFSVGELGPLSKRTEIAIEKARAL